MLYPKEDLKYFGRDGKGGRRLQEMQAAPIYMQPCGHETGKMKVAGNTVNLVTMPQELSLDGTVPTPKCL